MAKKDIFALENLVESKALFSPCKRYRYTLTRIWDADKPPILFIGLNPSTADEKTNDPTIRRCMRYAYDWGGGGILMMNLFAFRATKPAEMKRAVDPIGFPANNEFLLSYAQATETQGGTVVAAWGAQGAYMGRGYHVQKMLKEVVDLRCLKILAGGEPGHPLYLKSDLRLIPYNQV